MTTFIARRWSVLALCALALPARGEEEPKWEAGFGAGVVSFAEYRGSNRQRTMAVPVPYFVYHGDIFRSDRNGVRGMLFDGERVKLSVSLSASLPVDSDDHGPRRGMPDLQPTGEIGPALQVRLWNGEKRDARLDLRLPVRGAFTLRGGVHYAGLVFDPNLNYNAKVDLFGRPDWNFGLLAGPIFANARQHKYFYEVEPRYATPSRPAWSASGGYSGAQFIASLSRRFDKFWLGGFVRYDNLQGAAFVDSPLVKRRHAWAGGLGIAWILGESEEKVGRGE